MIRIDAMWMATQPVDMRAGADRLFARVVQVFADAQAHHGYVFTNARGTRMKLVVHDGFGVWCATAPLNQDRFAWTSGRNAPLPPLTLTQGNSRPWSWVCRGSAWRTYRAYARAKASPRYLVYHLGRSCTRQFE